MQTLKRNYLKTMNMLVNDFFLNRYDKFDTVKVIGILNSE